MGSSESKEAEEGGSLHQYNEFTEHPLLVAIDNPINRFCDDFASSLVEDVQQRNSKNESTFANTEIEQVQGYTIIRRIGEGAEATVYEATKLGSSTSIALKHFKKDKRMRDEFPKEVEIARALHHPHCLPILDSFKSEAGEYYIAMPIARHGALNVPRRPELTVLNGGRFLLQIGSALEHMHANGYVHRDVKPQNVLIFDDGYSLCDFSVSTKLQKPDEDLSGEIGTSFFMAPQVANQENYKPKPADMWSLGVTIFLLLYGTYPYNLEKVAEQANPDIHVNNISRIKPLCDLEFPECPVIPNEMKEIIAGLLEKNPEKRLTAEQLIQNEWLINIDKECSKLMSMHPDSTNLLPKPADNEKTA